MTLTDEVLAAYPSDLRAEESPELEPVRTLSSGEGPLRMLQPDLTSDDLRVLANELRFTACQ